VRAWILVALTLLGGLVAGGVVWMLLSGVGTAEPALMREACMQSLERLYRHVEKQTDDAELRTVLLGWQASQGPSVCPECFGGEMAYEANPWLRTVGDVRTAREAGSPVVMVFETRVRHSNLMSTPARRRRIALLIDVNGNPRIWEGTAEAYWKAVVSLSTHSDKGSVQDFLMLSESP